MEAYKKRVIDDLTKPALDRWLKHLRESPSDSLEESRRRLMEATKLVDWIDQLTDPRGIPFHTSKQQQLFLEKHPPPEEEIEIEEETNPRKAEYYGNDEPVEISTPKTEDDAREAIQQFDMTLIHGFMKHYTTIMNTIRDELEGFYDTDPMFFTAVATSLMDGEDNTAKDEDLLGDIYNAYYTTKAEEVNAMSAQEIVDKSFEFGLPTENDEEIYGIGLMRDNVLDRIITNDIYNPSKELSK